MENAEAYSRLVAAVATNATAMVGAGSSRRVGFPLWPELLNEMGTHAANREPAEAAYLSSIERSEDLLSRASEYERVLGRPATREFLAKRYGPENAPFDDVHRILIRLPFRHFLTANYDRVLESAYADVAGERAYAFDFDERTKTGEFVDRCRLVGYPRSIVHVHGSISRPDPIILTLDDYNNRYVNSTWASGLLNAIFVLYPCVFLGCGLSEEDLGPLRFLTAVLGQGEPKHFAIMQETSAAEMAPLQLRLRKRYRIEPVFYPASPGHQALLPFLTKLLDDVQAYQQDARASAVLEPSFGAQTLFNDVLGSILADQPEKVAEAKKALITRLSSRRTVVSTAVAADTDDPCDIRSAVDSEIDSAFRYVKEGQPEVAIELYRKILEREGERLNPRLRYRLHANIGNAYNSMHARGSAAAEYLLAAKLQDTRDARAMEAMAYVLREEYSTAHELARALCEQEPDFPRAYWLLVVSAPESTPFSVVELSVPETFRRNGEVAMALGGYAFAQGHLGDSERYGRIAVETTPDWVDPLVNLAATLLASEKRTATIDIAKGLLPKEPARVREAEQLITRAIALVPKNDPASHLPKCYLNRASARRFLGDVAGADADIREAYTRDSSDPDILLAYAIQLRQDSLNAAIEALEVSRESKSHWKVACLLASFLHERRAADDARTGLALLAPWKERLDEIGAQAAGDFAQLAAALYMDQKDIQGAKDFVASIPATAFPASERLLILARIHRAAGEPEDAKQCLLSAVEPLKTQNDWFALREGAMLAETLGDAQTALRLWKQLLPRTLLNNDTLHVLSLARHNEDDVFLLELCSELRKNRVADSRVVQFEIETLDRCREPATAISLARAWLESNPDDRDIRLQLSLLGIEQDQPKLVEQDPARLPRVSEVPTPQGGAAVVDVLRHTPCPIDAVRYAYDLCRRFPDDPVAQASLIAATFGPARAEIDFTRPSRVEPDTAVTYREGDAPAILVAIVETGSEPRPSQSEYAWDHPLIRAMAGKGAGDRFEYMGRGHVIVAVENKLLHRAREFMETYDRNFPENEFIRRFTLPKECAGCGDPEKALGEMWKVLAADDKRRQQAEGLYVSQAIPVPLLARRLGRTTLEALGYLSAKRGVPIWCCGAEGREWNHAAAGLRDSKSAVLDSTAVATLFMLGLHTKLKKLPFRCIIPEGTIQELRQLIRRTTPSQRRQGYMGVHDGKLFLTENSSEADAMSARNLQQLVEVLTTDCEVVGGSAILDFDVEIRKKLTDAFGPGVADAIAIARKTSAMLWTDDLGIGAIAFNDWKIKRIWTDLVLLTSLAALGSSDVNRAIAQLVMWEYEFTPLTADAAVMLLSEANWRLTDPAIATVVEQITRLGALNPLNCGITQQIIDQIWRRCGKEGVAKKMIASLLDGIGRSVAGEQIARPLYRRPLRKKNNGSTRKLRRLSRFLRKWRSTMPPGTTPKRI